jgi:hypothetical protein
VTDEEYQHAKRRAVLVGIALVTIVLLTAITIVAFVLIGNANADRQRDHDDRCAAQYGSGSVDYFMCVGP